MYTRELAKSPEFKCLEKVQIKLKVQKSSPLHME